MGFTGWPLSTLLPLSAGVAAAVIALYVLRLRRRPVLVPFSVLWHRVLGDRDTTSLFSRLKRLLSLLLQLVLLSLLVLALADPRETHAGASVRHIVALVDTSASMQAIDVAPSRLGAAKAHLKRLIASLGDREMMLLASMSTTLRPMTPMTSDTAQLVDAVDALMATEARADLRRGLEFAVDSLRGLSRPTIVVLSDGAFGSKDKLVGLPPLGNVELKYVPLGKSSRNVGITQFSVRRYPLDASRFEIMLELTNTASESADVELELLGDGKVVDVSRLTLRPEERIPRFYENQAGARRTLEARIRTVGDGSDELPADDRAYAVMPERKRISVLAVTGGNTYLEAALLLDEYLNVTYVRPEQYSSSEGYDVTIFDAAVPDGHESARAALYLSPPVGRSVVPLGKAIKMFGFDTWDRKSPLLRWMAMGDIQVLEGRTFEPEPSDHVVGASELGPLLVSGHRGQQRFVALSFDPRVSDFVLRVGWPLFLINTIRYFEEQDTAVVSSLRTGELWHLRVPWSTDRVQLVGPKGQSTTATVQDGRVTFSGERAGFYKIELPKGVPAQSQLLAANLASPEESSILPARELILRNRKSQPLGELNAGGRRELWVYLLAAAIALSVLEWFTYHRRLTV